MLSLNDIVNVSFRKAGRGYNAEDVDSFIDQIRESYDTLMKKTIEQHDQLEAAEKEKAQFDKKLQVLADKIQEYRQEEDGIKSALLSAQKLGDASLREARHKSEVILNDANMKAEKIIADAENQVKGQQEGLDEMKRQVSDFRSKLLDMYKQHLTLINSLPHSEKPASKMEKNVAKKEEETASPEEKGPEKAANENAPEAQQTAPETAEQKEEKEPNQPEPVSFSPVSENKNAMNQVPSEYILQPNEMPRFDGSVPDVQRAKDRHHEIKFGDGYDVDTDAEEDIFGKKN